MLVRLHYLNILKLCFIYHDSIQQRQFSSITLVWSGLLILFEHLFTLKMLGACLDHRDYREVGLQKQEVSTLRHPESTTALDAVATGTTAKRQPWF